MYIFMRLAYMWMVLLCYPLFSVIIEWIHILQLVNDYIAL